MPNKRYQCRTHSGGIFSMPARRGRPPVRCTAENPCDKVPAIDSDKLAMRVAITDQRLANREAPKTNTSLPLAMTAKEKLVAQGWDTLGHAREDWAEITASRGDETLVMRWEAGKLIIQDYSLFSEKASENGIPAHRLTFDPDEVTDSELVRLIRGVKVTWWNVLGSREESAFVGASKISIEHIYEDDGQNSKRIVKFVEHGGGGFRAFHASALLRIG